MQHVQNFVRQQVLAGFAYGFDTRANASARLGNLFVGRARDAFLEIHQPRRNEHGMSVGIDEPGQNNLTLTVNLDDSLAILLEPGIAQRVFGVADGNNLPADTKDGSVFYDAEFAEFRAAAWARF